MRLLGEAGSQHGVPEAGPDVDRIWRVPLHGCLPCTFPALSPLSPSFTKVRGEPV